MPEIVEVALMADAIREIISGKKLQSVTILGGRYLKNGIDNLDQLSENLPMGVMSVNVKGKFCWIKLENDWYIAITFGMSGAIYYEPTEEVLDDYSETNGKKVSRQDYMKHFHIKFETTNGQCFYYGDMRRFGTITISDDRRPLDKKLSELGPDMLTGQPITDQQFVDIFRQTKFNKKNICKVLMEQKAISGVGNYLKAETLYCCHINPWALVSDLDDETLINLHHAIRRIALQAYHGHGATLYTYSGTRREKGTFQDMLKVYGKDVDPLGNKVITIPEDVSPDRRTTHYVPSQQTIGNQRDPRPKKKIVITVKNIA
jgi:formamidopyrimidine-DNA glycosylase